MPEQNAKEYSSYRLVLKIIYAFIAGTMVILLATSVMRQLFFPPQPTVKDPIAIASPDPDEIANCTRALLELDRALSRKARSLLAMTDGGKIIREWETYSSHWSHKWRSLGAKCQFRRLSEIHSSNDYANLADGHEGLQETRLRLQDTVLRYANRQADAIAANSLQIKRAAEKILAPKDKH